MAKKVATKAALKTVAPVATTFKDLAIAFESMSQPTSEKMLQLEQQAWALLQGVAAQVDWSDYRVSPMFISGPFANWWAFVEDVGRTGNVKAAFPEVVKVSRTTDASEWQSRILADVAVCQWIEDAVLDQTPNELLNRLVRLAGHFSERVSWQWIIELRHDLKSLEGLALAWTKSGLAQAQCNLDMLRHGVAKMSPLLQKHVPAVDVVHMPIPSEAEIVTYCDRCQQLKSELREIEAALLVEATRRIPPKSPEKNWTPDQEEEARRLIDAGEISKAAQLPEKMRIKKQVGLALHRHITGRDKKPHHSD
ncbi:MAG: hypothetical protein U0929_13525 [Planctomycetaceae bacterium]